MSSDIRIALIILAVEDVPRAVRFYRDAFGWTQEVSVPIYAEFRSPGGLRFGVYERTAFSANTGQVPDRVRSGALTSTEFYLYPDDLPDAMARLERAGARLLSPLAPRSWGDEAAYFADPDGNVLVLARPGKP
jgi:catechol 2,3-dioxygenase-like lactoylglutathione lyase family enzyme